ncbi:MAG: glycosyltransferase [Pseudomonadota bacterium]
MPELTVIMANRNGADFLADAVKAVLAQEFRDLELIVSDDGSSDNSLQLLSAFDDPRLRVLASTESTGPSGARNRALDVARGQWIGIVDADDLMHPTRFQTLMATAHRRNAMIVADNQLFFIGDDRMTGETLFPAINSVTQIETEALLAPRFAGAPNMLGYLKPLVGRDLLEGLRYRADLRVGEDFDLLVRLSMAGHALTLVPEPLYYYRRRTGSLSHRLTPEDAGAMITALSELPSQTAAQANAIKVRISALQKRMNLEGVVSDLKARQIGQAMMKLARSPSTVPALGEIAKRKLLKDTPLTTTGKLPHYSSTTALPQRPKVHIRVPTYKRPEQLRRALQGLRHQTETNWHCDVYDDDPNGTSRQVVADLKDSRISYHANPRNLQASMNIDQCFTKLNPHNAEYFCVLEDDNQVLPTHLEDNIRVIEREEVQIVLRNQLVEYASGTDNARLSKTGLFEEKFVEGIYHPERFHLALMADMGVSNGGLFWSRKAISNLEIGVAVSATLQEYLRTLAVVEPIYVAMKPTAVWAENGENTTRDLGASTGWLKRELKMKRSVQILQRYVWRKAGEETRRGFLQGSGFSYPAALRLTGLVKSHTYLFPGSALPPMQTLRLILRGFLIRIVGRPEPGLTEYLKYSENRREHYCSPLSPSLD